MPSFDVTSEMDWQSLDDAINQALKEIGTRYDFKMAKTEIVLDRKTNILTLWVSDPAKREALQEIFYGRCAKRGISRLSFESKGAEEAFGGSLREKFGVQAGISKEKGKEMIAALKESGLKVQAQIQDEKVRVMGKNRDDLQSAIAYLKGKSADLKVPMQFGNFRE